jgi:hypothetical protein
MIIFLSLKVARVKNANFVKLKFVCMQTPGILKNGSLLQCIDTDIDILFEYLYYQHPSFSHIVVQKSFWHFKLHMRQSNFFTPLAVVHTGLVQNKFHFDVDTHRHVL